MQKKSSIKRLDFCNFKLDTILEITKSINENVSTKQLLKLYADVLTNKLNIGQLAVYAYNDGWKEILLKGKRLDDLRKVDINAAFKNISEITTIPAAGLEKQFYLFDTIIPVYHNNRPVAFVLIGDIDEERKGISPTIKHLLFVQTLTNIIIVAIENRRLTQDSIKQEAIKKELELASRMQSMLVPRIESFPRNDKIYVDAFYLPHFDVGGDYYDFFPLNEYEYGFCISDVSGKGMSAAILMSNFQANLKALFTSHINIIDLVKTLNQRVWDSANGEKFITMFIGKYNSKTRNLTYINAGHNASFYFDKTDKKLSYLDVGCPGLGMLDELPFIKFEEIEIKHNTKIFCYTDGLIEQKGQETTDHSMELVGKCLSDDKRIDISIAKIIESLNINKQNNAFFDDISILGFEIF